jgi:hypothetical protein
MSATNVFITKAEAKLKHASFMRTLRNLKRCACTLKVEWKTLKKTKIISEFSFNRRRGFFPYFSFLHLRFQHEEAMG